MVEDAEEIWIVKARVVFKSGLEREYYANHAEGGTFEQVKAKIIDNLNFANSHIGRPGNSLQIGNTSIDMAGVDSIRMWPHRSRFDD